jgi:ribosomal protein S18 acetylase RimI-like enzyme
VLLTRRGSSLARIYSVVVDAAARGQGLGAKLVSQAEAAARAAGCRAILLEVRVDNRAAAALYARAGYLQAARLRGYYDDGSDGVRLRKSLVPAGILRPAPR